MKILFIGDIHIVKDNIQNVYTLIDAVVNLSIDIVVIAGDILDTHERVHTQLMNVAYDLIYKISFKFPTFILVGNHDYINNSQYLTKNHWMTGLKERNNITIVDTVIKLDDIIFLPYVPLGRFKEALDSSNYNWKNAMCIFAHQEIKGCSMGPIQSIDGDEWMTDWPLLISGHVHERQQPQQNVKYPGSSLNKSFGKDSQGISIFDTENNFSEERIDLKLIEKRIIYLNLQLGETIKSHNLVPTNKFSIEGTLSDIQAFKKTQEYSTAKKIVKIVFRIKEDDQVRNYAPKRTFSEILGTLIKTQNDVNLDLDYKCIAEL